MDKPKWVVEAKYETREEIEEYHRKQGTDIEDFEIEDFNEVEISILREDNGLGKRSYGWDDDNKIILFNEIEEVTEERMKWYKEVAETICETLNRKGL